MTSPERLATTDVDARPIEPIPLRWIHFIPAGIGMAPVIVLATIVLAPPMCRPANSILVRNASPAVLEDVVVRLTYDSKLLLEERIPEIPPGATHRIPHRFHDSYGELTFVAEGREFAFSSDFIDLWPGQSWAFEIRPGFEIVDGYDHDGTLVSFSDVVPGD